jgi:hypothetical protein
MTNPNRRHLIVIIDRSGSMWDCMEETEKGINSFFAAQAKEPGATTASMYEFDDQVDCVFSHLPIADVPQYHLKPRKRTALLDAIGFSITKEGDLLAALPEDERPGSVVVLIATDGVENASFEYTLEEINNMITEQRTVYGWQLIFMGANMDAVKIAKSYGIPSYDSITYDTRRAGETYAVVNSAVTRKLHGNGGGFTDAERATASGVDGA